MANPPKKSFINHLARLFLGAPKPKSAPVAADDGATPARAPVTQAGDVADKAKTGTQATPLDRAREVPKKRSKLARNLVGMALIVVLGGMVVATLIKQGGNLEDEAVVAAEKQRKEEDERRNYARRVDNPVAEADAMAAAAEAVAAKPVPGAAVPLPSDADIVLRDDMAKLDPAWRAIIAGRKTAEETPAAPQQGDVGSAQADRPGFVSYAVTLKDGVASSQPTSGIPHRAASTRSSGSPEAAEVRERALALQEAQAQQAAAEGGQRRTTTGDANESWLARNRNKPLAAAEPIQAKRISGRQVVFAGTAISAVLEQGIDTSLPGKIRARVALDVYDSKSQSILVVPRGSLLLGEYRSAVSDGQTRVLIGFDRLLTPQGLEVPLGMMAASDGVGVGGVPGELHTHFWKRMGIAALLGLESALLEKKVGAVGAVAATGQSQSTSSAAGQIMLQTANQELQRQYAVAPNITVPPGSLITLILAESVEIPTRTERSPN